MPKKIKLPTLAQFKKLALEKRQALFTRFVGTKKGPYFYYVPRECPLGLFGAALLGRNKELYAVGVTEQFVIRNIVGDTLIERVEVLSSAGGSALVQNDKTFEALYLRLKALAKEQRAAKKISNP